MLFRFCPPSCYAPSQGKGSSSLPLFIKHAVTLTPVTVMRYHPREWVADRRPTPMQGGCLMQHYLLFDSGCLTCSKLAQAIEDESKGWLVVRSLREPEMQELLTQARLGWSWEPTLVEVEEEQVRTYTGLALRTKMLMGLGPQKTWRVTQLVAQAGLQLDGVNAERRKVLKLGGALIGGLALGLGWGMPDLRAHAASSRAVSTVASDPS